MPRLSDPRRGRAVRAFAALLTVALVASGCAGTTAETEPIPTPTNVDLDGWDPESGNGIHLLNGQSARSVLLTAVREAGTAGMSGTFTAPGGREIVLDVHGSSEEVVAEFTVDERTTSIVVADGQTYVNPASPLADALDLTAGVYSCVDADSAAVTQWGALPHPLQTLAEQTADAASLGEPVDGTVDLILGAEGTLGTISVPTDGPPLPISLTRADAAGTLELEFSRWGEEIALPDLADAAGC